MEFLERKRQTERQSTTGASNNPSTKEVKAYCYSIGLIVSTFDR